MEELYTRLEDYLDGRLSEEDRLAMEADLRTDSALAEQLALLVETRSVLGAHLANAKKEEALSATLHKLNQHYFSAEKGDKIPDTTEASTPPARRVPMYTRILAVAALIAGAIMAAVWLLQPAAPPVYADYARHSPADFSEMGSGEQLMSDAAQAFNQGRYQRAAVLLEQAVFLQADRPDLRLYYGIALLETGQHDKATQTLNQLTSQPDYQNEAYWYLALNALAQEQTEQVKTYLAKIGQGSSRYAQAQELVSRLP